MPRRRETDRRRARLSLADAQTNLQRAQESAASAAAAVEAALEVPEQLARALAQRRTALVALEQATAAMLQAVSDYQLTAWTDAQLIEISARRMRPRT